MRSGRGCAAVGHHGLEVAVGEVAEGAHRLGMPQQALGREDDQRLAHAAAVRAAVHLAAQQVEVLGRGGGSCTTWMLSSAQSCRKRSMRALRVLRALAFVAVRQQQHQAAGLAPLGLAGDDELVDHDLGAVGEVAELGLPQDQGERVAERVAELEAHARRTR